MEHVTFLEGIKKDIPSQLLCEINDVVCYVKIGNENS